MAKCRFCIQVQVFIVAFVWPSQSGRKNLLGVQDEMKVRLTFKDLALISPERGNGSNAINYFRSTYAVES